MYNLISEVGRYGSERSNDSKLSCCAGRRSESWCHQVCSHHYPLYASYLTFYLRRVTTTSSTGSTDSTRVRLNLTIRVKKVSMVRIYWTQRSYLACQTSFSPSASSSNGATSQDPKNSTATLQINGTVTNENDYVKLGAHHTLDLEGKPNAAVPLCVAHSVYCVANRDFRLYKASGWDSVSLERIEEATKEGRGADVGAVVLGEGKFSLVILRSVLTPLRPRHNMSSLGTHDRHSSADRLFHPA